MWSLVATVNPSLSASRRTAGAHDIASQAAFAVQRKAFRALHERGCFVIPNPWDVGSARYLQHLGFPALATTSAGFAFSQGLPDSGDVLSLVAIGPLATFRASRLQSICP